MKLQQINELFDQPYDYNWTTSVSNLMKAEFKTETGDLVEVMFGYPSHEDGEQWGMVFSRNDSMGKTSEGDAVRIFTTVIKIAGEFIEKVKPQRFFFTAEKSADRKDNRPSSRIMLYKRLVNRFASKAGYEVDMINRNYQVEYRLHRKKVYEEITTLSLKKDDKLGINFDNFYETSGEKIGRVGDIEVWKSDTLGRHNNTSGLLLWDPKEKQAAGVVFFKQSLSSSLQNLHPNTIVISVAVVNQPYEGRGLVMKSYVVLMKKGYALLSDDLQSPGGRKIWSRLAKTPGITVYAVNLDTNDAKISAINPDDTSDADFMVYSDDRDDLEQLDLAVYNLEKKKTDMTDWLVAAKRKLSRGGAPARSVDIDEYEEMEDKLKALEVELAATREERKAMQSHVRGGENSRLMAVANKPRKSVKESEIIKPHPKDTLGIKRKDMPQIHKNHYPKFITYLKDHGARVSMKRVHARELKPVQSEFSDVGVKKMMTNKDDTKGTTREKPLIVSSDNYIIDGHHRWLASYNLDEDIPIMQFSIPIKTLFQLTKDFKHTTYKDIHEEVMTEALKDAYPYEIVIPGPDTIKASFETDSGSDVIAQMAVIDDYYLATLAHYADFDLRDVQGVTGDDVWEFFFKRDGSVELTNKGDQFKIFATVVAVFREFVKKKQPKVISFSSSKHEEGGKGRAPLYKRFAAAFAKESGYRVKEFDLLDEYYFLLFAPGVQLESMSMMERACLEGGHIYERDLEEISKIPPLKNDDANMQRMPQRLKQIKDGLFTKITELNDKLDLYMSNDLARYGRDGYVIVTDKALTTVMSFLRVYSAGNMVVYAGMAWTHPKHRRQGLSTILYEALLSKGFHLETDSSQTTSGKAIWKHLISKHGGYLLRDGKVDRPVKTDKDFEQAYKRNAPYTYTLLIKSPQTELDLAENISITGTITSKEDRKKNLIPGSDEWFRHWFSRPYLKREDVDRLKEEAIKHIKNRKGVQHEKKTRYRRDSCD